MISWVSSSSEIVILSKEGLSKSSVEEQKWHRLWNQTVLGLNHGLITY